MFLAKNNTIQSGTYAALPRVNQRNFLSTFRLPACLAASVILASSCSKTNAPKKEEPRTAEKEEKSTTVEVRLATSSFPDARGDGGYSSVSPELLAGGFLNKVINISTKYENEKASADEKDALASGFFSRGPGFRFTIRPASQVKLILKSPSGESQERKIEPSLVSGDKLLGTFTISLMSFGNIFPPKSSGVFSLQILDASDAKVKKFDQTISFSTYVASVENAGYISRPFPLPANLEMGKDSNEFLAFSADADQSKCGAASCEVSFSEVKIFQNATRIIELPALPENSARKLSALKRFSGRLEQNKNCQASFRVENEGGSAKLMVRLIGNCTTTEPWCFKNKTTGATKNSKCEITNGSYAGKQTFFGFANVVPKDDAINLLGHVEGFSQTNISGCLNVKVSSRGEQIKEVSKQECFASPSLSGVSSSLLPDWGRNLMQEAIFSSMPSFSIR